MIIYFFNYLLTLLMYNKKTVLAIKKMATYGKEEEERKD